MAGVERVLQNTVFFQYLEKSGSGLMVGLRGSQAGAAVGYALSVLLSVVWNIVSWSVWNRESSMVKQVWNSVRFLSFEIYSAFKYILKALRIPVDRKRVQ